MENLIESTKQPSEIINAFTKGARYKVNIQKSIVFLFTSNKSSEIEILNVLFASGI